MRTSLFSIGFSLVLLSGASAPVSADDQPPKATLLIVEGAAGDDEYGRQFAEWAARWAAAGQRGGVNVVQIGSSTGGEKPAEEASGDTETDRDRLRAQLTAATESNDGKRSELPPLWVVLIGHGTFNGKQAKFNLRGPDFSAEELAEWCEPIKRPLAIIDTSSASGPFLPALSGPRRVVITATRSGQEQNFARLGDELSAAIDDPSADLDKDGQVSLLEAYLRAAHRVEQFYQQAGRLATEHALLDDNGDGLGTPAGWFQGIWATRRAKSGAALDGSLVHRWHLVPGDQEQRLTPEARSRRDELERQISELRATRSKRSEEAQLNLLEPLLVELARLHRPAADSAAP